jgi:cell division protein FtsL
VNRRRSDKSAATRFVGLWTLAVVATASAFILYLALRSRGLELGYKLGRARARQAQLRETRRVLQVEAVSYRNPERIEALAKGVLRLEEPPPQRIFMMGGALEPTLHEGKADGKVEGKPKQAAPAASSPASPAAAPSSGPIVGQLGGVP